MPGPGRNAPPAAPAPQNQPPSSHPQSTGIAYRYRITIFKPQVNAAIRFRHRTSHSPVHQAESKPTILLHEENGLRHFLSPREGTKVRGKETEARQKTSDLSCL